QVRTERTRRPLAALEDTPTMTVEPHEVVRDRGAGTGVDGLDRQRTCDLRGGNASEFDLQLRPDSRFDDLRPAQQRVATPKRHVLLGSERERHLVAVLVG